ncbi:antibiotic biosynthesis monooxygenase [Thalassotalea insulae]|uniref:Antibiotic biosynthesis monooxygenase n=1 Tax=Thalassotalea insulae TaxID=2056778 RepID=A0ABQ6GQ94_9GAMM|nr:antibiotic biosynthesis monooxygenase [Thalassotalea insulae]GLX77349.1 antibiotic biosynthesis monooxygenase [Thalassotalea insulae]
MIAVIFEVEIKNQENKAQYFERAAELKDILLKMPGFISIERFQSVASANRYLSLSFWQDEASVKGWRQQMIHRAAQQQGREQLFEDYRIRVANVMRDYGMTAREQAPDT